MYSCGSKLIIPKNETEQKKFEREIRKTGTIKTDYQLAPSDQVAGISKVTEEEITPQKKAKSSVRSKRSQRRTSK